MSPLCAVRPSEGYVLLVWNSDSTAAPAVSIVSPDSVVRRFHPLTNFGSCASLFPRRLRCRGARRAGESRWAPPTRCAQQRHNGLHLWEITTLSLRRKPCELAIQHKVLEPQEEHAQTFQGQDSEQESRGEESVADSDSSSTTESSACACCDDITLAGANGCAFWYSYSIPSAGPDRVQNVHRQGSSLFPWFEWCEFDIRGFAYTYAGFCDGQMRDVQSTERER